MSESQRNILILVLVAAAIAIVGGGAFDSFNQLSTTLLLALNVAFFAAIGYALYMWYKKHEHTISTMDAKWRQLIIGCGVMGYIVLFTGLVHLPWVPGFGWAGANALSAIAFFALMAGCGFGIYHAWQQRPFKW